MGDRQRPRHHGRGRGASAPRSEPRVLVLPGDEIPDRGLRPGFGTYRVGRRLYASVMGYATWRPPFVRIVPFAGRYIPKAEDVVVGVVQDFQKTFWLLDIGAPRWAPLHVSGTPWKPEPGELDQFLRIGDAVLVAVETLDPTGRIGVTMVGEGLGKLEGGTIVHVSPAKVPRIIGKGGSMIHTITELTHTQVAIGQNGRIWVQGAPDAIARARACFRIIEEEGERPGLTERIEEFLAASEPQAGAGGLSPSARSPLSGPPTDGSSRSVSPDLSPPSDGLDPGASDGAPDPSPSEGDPSWET
jgi:exosome complex component RRP4